MNRKARNGQGEGLIISVTFNPEIPIEAKALRMSQRLANIGHGVRKSVVVASLAALADFSQMVGKDLTTEELSAMFLSALINGGVNQTQSQLQIQKDEDEILIETDGSGISYEDIAESFIGTSTMQQGTEDLWD